MKDPFVIAPIPWLAELVRPWCDRLNMPTLPLHIHEVVISALLYSIIFWPLSPFLSKLVVPHHYSKLSRKTRLNWDAHVVSMVQSCLINGLSIWVICVDDERWNMDWQERVWGYTGANAMIQALASGYFVWDLFVTSFNVDVFGVGTLAHAISALLAYSLGFVRENPLSLSVCCSSANFVVLVAPLRQLLLAHLHPLGTVDSFSQHSLVHGQGEHDGKSRSALQRCHAFVRVLHLSAGVRYLSLLLCYDGHTTGRANITKP